MKIECFQVSQIYFFFGGEPKFIAEMDWAMAGLSPPHEPILVEVG